MKARTRAAVLLLSTLLGAALTARLGVWQLDRAAQKQALQEAMAARDALPPLNAAALLTDPVRAGEQQLHRRVLLRGHWLADRTVFLDNRPMDGRAGFFVVTPLQLEERPEAVLVQRGWVPRDAQDRSRLPALPAEAGPVQLLGRLAAAPSRLFELGQAAPGAIRQNLGVPDFARETGLALLPLTVWQLDAPAAAGRDGLLRDWAAPDAGLQKHYGYAFQWFALCALILGLYVWFQLLRPRRTRPA
jgi:surfeit locus 1 family protein